jgi:hypothetical protein
MTRQSSPRGRHAREVSHRSRHPRPALTFKAVPPGVGHAGRVRVPSDWIAQIACTLFTISCPWLRLAPLRKSIMERPNPVAVSVLSAKLRSHGSDNSRKLKSSAHGRTRVLTIDRCIPDAYIHGGVLCYDLAQVGNGDAKRCTHKDRIDVRSTLLPPKVHTPFAVHSARLVLAGANALR